MAHRILFFAILLTAPLFGQGTFGSLTGIVQDTSGAVIPNVTVKVTNQATAIDKTAITNDRGDYEVTHLNPGTYTVSAEAAGFRKFEHRDVLVQALQTVRIDVKFEVGAVGSAVDATRCRTFVVDDGKATRTPAAWMISPLLHTQHKHPHAFGVDDALRPRSCSQSVPRLGHFSQAAPGHSCAAPKHSR